MAEIAGWVAPIATMIAAMMTASNLGARMTGWGFVVFTVGSISWTLVGVTSGQTNLVAANGFLILINIIGVWRWLGRQAAYEDGGQSAKKASRTSSSPSLFTATGISGMAVVDENERTIGHAVEALVECATAAVSYVVVAEGGIAGIEEKLRAVPGQSIKFKCDRLRLNMSGEAFRSLPSLAPGRWPVSAEAVSRQE